MLSITDGQKFNRTALAVILFLSFVPFALNFLSFSNKPVFDEDARIYILSAFNWMTVAMTGSASLFAFFHYSFSKNATLLLMGVMLFWISIGDIILSTFDYSIKTIQPESFSYLWILTKSIRMVGWITGIFILLKFDIKNVKLSTLTLTIVLTSIALFSFFLISFLSTLPPPKDFDSSLFWIKRPWNWIPFFLAASVGYPLIYSFNQKFPSYFSHSFLIALIPLILSHLSLALSVHTQIDNHFLISSYLTMITGAVLLLGICFDYLKAHKDKNQLLEQLKNSVIQRDAVQRAKVHFVETITDQILKPISGVLNASHLLLKTQLNQNQRKLARIISISSENLIGKIGEIVDFSKADYFRVDTDHILFNIKKSLTHSVEPFEQIAKNKKIQLHLHIFENIPTYVFGNKEKVDHIFKSLLHDVIRASKPGAISIKFFGYLFEKGEWNYSLQIEYLGADLRSENMESFKAAKELVESLNGSIEIDELNGSGWKVLLTTTFAVKKMVEVPNHLEESLLGYKILIASPDNSERSNIIDELTLFGVEHKTANSTLEALQLLEKEDEFDFYILSDSPPAIEIDPLIEKINTLNQKSMIVITSDESKELQEPIKLFYRPLYPSDLYYALSDFFYNKNPILSTEERDVLIPKVSVSPLSALVVAEDCINQLAFKESLEYFGCSVDVANNPNQALEHLKHKTYDALFIDCLVDQSKHSNLKKLVEHARLLTFVVGVISDSIQCPSGKELLDAEIAKPIHRPDLLAILKKIKLRAELRL